MQTGYLFISNDSPNATLEASVEPVHVTSFAAPSIHAANEMGWKIYQGINRNDPSAIRSLDYDITYYNQHIYRSIFDIRNNWIAYKNLCAFLKEHPEIDIIHCNTPIGGVLGRICGHKYNKKVVYTAHGFHFFKGAPLLNRTVFKWIEQWMARYTDILITINHEDYEAAQKMHLKKGGKVEFVAGVGMNLKGFVRNESEIIKKKKELGFKDDAKLIMVVGDVNDNKNVTTLIDAIALCPSNYHMLVCGMGPLLETLKVKAADLGISEQVHFLGFRTDVRTLLYASDLFLMGSKREGLPRSTMEAMAAGLPCVCSKIRGNVDLIDEGKGGFLVNPLDAEAYAKAIKKVMEDEDLSRQMGEYNKNRVKQYDISIINEEMVRVYKSL